MAESHEPRPPFTGTPAAPPAAPIQSVHSFITPPVERPGRWLVLRRTMRLLARRWLYVMTILFRWMRPFIGFVAAIAALLAVIVWMSVQLWWPADGPQDVRVAALPPSPAVEHYIQGQQQYNAELMWDAYSTAYKVAQLQRGVDKTVLQARADTERGGGLQYVHYDYIGGVRVDDSHSMYFYTIDRALAAQHAKFPFVFTADAQGKILDIESPWIRQQSPTSNQ